MKPLIRAIESSPFKNRFSIGQQVTYKYYAGLKAMMDEDYKSGEKLCWKKFYLFLTCLLLFLTKALLKEVLFSFILFLSVY